MMKIIKGNLIELADNDEFDIIIHGCNCFNTFGAGVAKQIKIKWPLAFKADLSSVKGDPHKLGLYSTAIVSTSNVGDLLVVNGYTQYSYGVNQPHVDYDAIRCVLTSVLEEYPSVRVGIPLIGGGLAGGDYQTLVDIFDEVSKGHDLTLVLLK